MKKRLETPMLLVIDMQNVYGKGQAWECSDSRKRIGTFAYGWVM